MNDAKRLTLKHGDFEIVARVVTRRDVLFVNENLPVLPLREDGEGAPASSTAEYLRSMEQFGALLARIALAPRVVIEPSAAAASGTLAVADLPDEALHALVMQAIAGSGFSKEAAEEVRPFGATEMPSASSIG